LGLDDILLDDATRGVANQVTGGFQNVSFGSEENLDTLVKEVSNWMLGNDPNARVVKQFEASIIDAEVER
jgi:signal recognition particle GTPase